MKKLYIIVFCLFVLGCSLKKSQSVVPLSEQIYVYAYRSKLKADGVDTTTIVARIPKDAGALNVSFSSSAGKFIYSGNQTDVALATIVNNQYRYAKTIFQTDASFQDSIFVTAEANSIRNRTVVYLSK